MRNVDILIAGGGPVGSILAHALAQGADRLRIMQVRGPQRAADRPLALSHGSRLILQRLNLWHGIASTPICRIHVSQRGGFGRTLIDAADHDIESLGEVIPYASLLEATTVRADKAGIETVEGQVTDWRGVTDGVEVDCGNASVRTRLLVIADGGAQESGQRIKHYGQCAVVCDVATDRHHGHMAWERFTPDGPVALLPHRDGYALVWTVPPSRATDLCALDENAFLVALSQAFGQRAGRFISAGPRAAFPLSLRVHRNRALPGVIAVGNASQTLHPVAGQGLNLGLRDAWELAEHCLAIFDQVGATDLLAQLASSRFARHYDARREFDRDTMVRLTDGLISAFSLHLPMANAVRGGALAFLDCVPPARRFLSRRMMFGARALP